MANELEGLHKLKSGSAKNPELKAVIPFEAMDCTAPKLMK
jgi:hypothetical protein